MKMKILKMKCAYVLILTFAFISACSDDNNDMILTNSENVYENMGRLHNEGLDKVLQKVSETSFLTKSGTRIMPEKSQIRQMCLEFVRSKGIKVFTKSSEKWYDRRGIPQFSLAQRVYLNELKRIVDSALPMQLDDFLKATDKLEFRLKKDVEINDNEKEILLHIMAVCRYSASYWAENYEKWQVQLFDLNNSTTQLIRTRGESVTKTWWEKYKYLVWADGMGGVLTETGYYLEGAIAASVEEVLYK